MPGLFDNNASSFESLNFPGHYIRHKNFELWIDASDGSDLFRKDATFSITTPLYLK
ncbi:AbfB domain-containing protein [Fischerella thermalis]|uniref:AbfB domain-containing protein n=1 Tax=Fischerella thermalis TaxID=372787 RepID=UPI001F329670|nr:AbfB domain-containing protein [Fischerella thermalis]